jgi:putative membrane protein
MTRDRIIREATFSPNAIKYHTLGATILCVVTIIGIPLLLIVLPITTWYWRKQYRNLRVVLTSRDLKVSRGVLIREEKSIPLEKITDLAVIQGPIMRHFGLKGIKVETAGQSGMGNALVQVVGIEDTDGFRDLVLQHRDKITDSDDLAPARGAPAAGSGASGQTPVAAEPVLETLRSIDETLRRIEQSLANREQAEPRIGD